MNKVKAPQVIKAVYKYDFHLGRIYNIILFISEHPVSPDCVELIELFQQYRNFTINLLDKMRRNVVY